MSQIDSMLMSMEEYTLNANQVKELVLERLERDGLISHKKAIDYTENWQIIVIKPSWFSRWSEKLGFTKTGYMFKFVQFEDADLTIGIDKLKK